MKTLATRAENVSWNRPTTCKTHLPYMYMAYEEKTRPNSSHMFPDSGRNGSCSRFWPSICRIQRKIETDFDDQDIKWLLPAKKALLSWCLVLKIDRVQNSFSLRSLNMYSDMYTMYLGPPKTCTCISINRKNKSPFNKTCIAESTF